MTNKLLPTNDWKLEVDIMQNGTLRLWARIGIDETGWYEIIPIPFECFSQTMTNTEQLAKLANALVSERRAEILKELDSRKDEP